MATCARCKTAKPASAFGADPRNKSGRQSYCKQCACEYKKERGYKTRKTTEKRRALRQSYRARFPEQNRAARAVNYAISTGKLTRQPCEICGERQVHAHHDDYSQPLNIRWLCHSHHRLHHVKAAELSEQS